MKAHRNGEQRVGVQGVTNIIRFNWDFYLAALAALLIGAVLLSVLPFPGWLLLLGWLGWTGVLYMLLASLLASWYIYDLTPMYRLEWLPDFLGSKPKRILNIHSGFDESSLKLHRVFPDASLELADFYDAALNTEKSIARARAAYPAPTATVSVRFDALPYPDGSFDAAFALFAAHEIREPEGREALFRELHRVAKTVILLEHGRDPANFAVYGPGALHFFPPAEWERVAAATGFRIARLQRVTPFVVAYRLEA